jgi:hypothetical protein
MDRFRLKRFEPAFDGNMSLAKRIVAVYRNSENFSLIEYEGRYEFYEEYLTKYDDYLKILNSLMIVSQEQLDLLERVRSALRIIANKQILNFSHFLVAYVQVFILSDFARGHVRINSAGATRAPVFTKDSTVENMINDMIEYGNNFPSVIPFTSQSGAFGLNTFFYLYLNGLYPVACSIDPYPVHNGNFPGSINTMGHDFTHIIALKRIDGTPISPSLNAGIEIFSENVGYFDYFRSLYLQVINSDLPEGQIKAFVIIMFMQIHEQGNPFTCKNIKRTVSLDEIGIMISNTYYTPAYLDVDFSKEILDQMKTNPGFAIPRASRYYEKFQEVVVADFCKLFG